LIRAQADRTLPATDADADSPGHIILRRGCGIAAGSFRSRGEGIVAAIQFLFFLFFFISPGKLIVVVFRHQITFDMVYRLLKALQKAVEVFFIQENLMPLKPVVIKFFLCSPSGSGNNHLLLSAAHQRSRSSFFPHALLWNTRCQTSFDFSRCPLLVKLLVWHKNRFTAQRINRIRRSACLRNTHYKSKDLIKQSK